MDAQRSYGPVQPTPENLNLLHHFVHPSGELKRAGYVSSQLSSADLQRKKRCQQCCKVLKKERRQNPPTEPKPPPSSVLGPISSNENGPQASSNGSDTVTGNQARTHPRQILDNATNLIRRTEGSSSTDSSFMCRYHPGRVVNRKWTCCNGPPFSKPCDGQFGHSPRHYKLGELEKNWQFYEMKPGHLPSHTAAVVLDCEMGTASSGESELIRLSMVDFFSGATLIDSLVYPTMKMAHYNTRFSGVTRQAMEDARRRKKCILGRDAARQAVHKFVGPDTIVIGHAGHQDLTSLRWAHHQVVDTLLIETKKRRLEADIAQRQQWDESENPAKDAPETFSSNIEDEDMNAATLPQEGGLSLKVLTLNRLNRVIQVKGRGHDSLEDALATRDLLHWHIAHTLEPAAKDLW